MHFRYVVSIILVISSTLNIINVKSERHLYVPSPTTQTIYFKNDIWLLHYIFFKKNFDHYIIWRILEWLLFMVDWNSQGFFRLVKEFPILNYLVLIICFRRQRLSKIDYKNLSHSRKKHWKSRISCSGGVTDIRLALSKNMFHDNVFSGSKSHTLY